MNFQTKHFLVASMLSINLLVVTGCERKDQSTASVAPPPPQKVSVTLIKPQKIVINTELPGRTSSYRVADIKPQVNGLIQKRLFVEGSNVKKGDVLYEIDPASFKAAYESAMATLETVKKEADRARAAMAADVAGVERQKATLALAKINSKRYEDLLKDRAVSASQRDQALTDVDVALATLHAAEAEVASGKAAVAAAEAAILQAKATVKISQINLDYTKVLAPISGRIGRSKITEGAIVTAYQDIMATIQVLDPIYVDVPQSTTDLMRLRRHVEDGQLTRNETSLNNVQLLFEDDSVYPHLASLKFQDISVDPTTGSVILRIIAPNPRGVLLPGMFLRARIEEGTQQQALLVPQQAVSRDHKGDPLILTVNDQNQVVQKKIVTDRAMGDQWLVKSGLASGDRVIVEGVQKIRPGSLVEVTPFNVNHRLKKEVELTPSASARK